jgi:hypothetical protein
MHADWSVRVDTTALEGHSCGSRPTHKQASIGTDYTEKKIKPQITQRRIHALRATFPDFRGTRAALGDPLEAFCQGGEVVHLKPSRSAFHRAPRP